ncbi:hypothetical protein [Rhodoglobus vestalii]|uniref:hypothetical protein n=1 Tax=Rhodoglobus vestalii TaxID=193384 RepID=UPI0014769007|nr:hypothetical protein [Rhodoglobus vestalii]
MPQSGPGDATGGAVGKSIGAGGVWAEPGAAIVGGGDAGGAAVGGGAVGVEPPADAAVGGGAAAKPAVSRRCDRRDVSSKGANSPEPSASPAGAVVGGGIVGAADGGTRGGGEKFTPGDSDEKPGDGDGGTSESRS